MSSMSTLRVGLSKYANGPRCSNRSDANMECIVGAAGLMWKPAGIQFDCDGVKPYPVEHANINLQIDDLSNRFLPTAKVDLVVFYLPRPGLDGNPVNGFNPIDSRIVFVSDTVNLALAKPPPEMMASMTGNTLSAASRVCAHEIGHILLGPGHPSNPLLLMFQGSTGELLTEANKTKAKAKAEEIIGLR